MRYAERHLTPADSIIVVTPSTRYDLLEAMPAINPDKVHVVTNGYPDWEPESALSDRDPERFTVLYAGSYHGSYSDARRRWLTPEIVLPILESLQGQPELRLMGPVSSSQADSLQSWPSTLLNHLGYRSREIAIAEMATADVCLLLGKSDPRWIGRKLYEYLAFARHILAVIPEGDIAEQLRDVEYATIVQLDDAAGLETALRTLHARWAETGSVGPIPRRSAVPTERQSVEKVAQLLRAVASTDR